MDSADEVLTPSKGGVVIQALGGLAALAAGIWMLGGRPTSGASLIVIGVLVLGTSAVVLVPGGAFLELGQDGFRARWMFRDWIVRWSDVQRFVAFNPSPNGMFSRSVVGAVYRAGYVPQGPKSSPVNLFFSRRTTGVDASLGSNYGLSAEELAELLNAHLDRARGSGAAGTGH